jgi:hypothetical protein
MRNQRSCADRLSLFVLVALFLLAASGTLWAQEDTRTEYERWPAGDFSDGEMESAGRKQQTWAIPGLEKVFARESDPWRRLVSAATLIELGSTEQQYWDFVEAAVRQAMAYRGPNPIKRSESGRMLDGKLSDEFIEWCAARNVDPIAYYGGMAYGDEARLFRVLAFFQDRRLIPLLREALQSNNPYVVRAAGKGLGERGDIEGLDLIVTRYRELGMLHDDDESSLGRVLARMKQSEIRKIPEQWRQKHQKALAEAEQSRPDAYKLQ